MPNRTFYIFDFDRCLGNTERLSQTFMEVVESHYGLTAEYIDMEKQAVEATGGSFDALTFIDEHLRERGVVADWTVVGQAYKHAAQQQTMLEKGAAQLLQALQDAGLGYGILTYGGERWQRLKLQAAGLGDVPAMITNQPDKGRIIQAWQQPDGSFQLPSSVSGQPDGLAVDSLHFFDDKLISFDDFPTANASGYWVTRQASEEVVAQLPANVGVVSSLEDMGQLVDKT